jgi:dinuclear metal center YbgI/SA1388 family protein
MNIQKIINLLNHKYPIETQEDFDQCGLFLEHNNNIDKVLVCLDISIDIVNFSIKNNINLLISHHPIFLDNEKYPLNEYNQKIIDLLKKNSIAILFLHTCFDKSDEGMNYILSKKIGLEKIQRLGNSEYLFKGELNNKIPLDAFLLTLPEILNINYANYHKYFEKKIIKTIAICGGSGSSFMNETKDKVDLYITCDMKYHN